MGMTIEEAIERLQDIQKCYNDEITEAMFLGFNDTDNESVNVAIETMRKYQKIQEIINNAKDSDGAVKYNWLYEQIREVAEDGKID